MKMKPALRLSCALLTGLVTLLAACNQAPEPAASPAAPAMADGNVSDIDVTTSVKTALLSDGVLKGFDISVVTTKGDVRLIGVVDTQAQIDSATAIARAAAGAHTIHDELTLKK